METGEFPHPVRPAGGYVVDAAAPLETPRTQGTVQAFGVPVAAGSRQLQLFLPVHSGKDIAHAQVFKVIIPYQAGAGVDVSGDSYGDFPFPQGTHVTGLIPALHIGANLALNDVQRQRISCPVTPHDFFPYLFIGSGKGCQCLRRPFSAKVRVQHDVQPAGPPHPPHGFLQMLHIGRIYHANQLRPVFPSLKPFQRGHALCMRAAAIRIIAPYSVHSCVSVHGKPQMKSFFHQPYHTLFRQQGHVGGERPFQVDSGAGGLCFRIFPAFLKKSPFQQGFPAKKAYLDFRHFPQRLPFPACLLQPEVNGAESGFAAHGNRPLRPA